VLLDDHATRPKLPGHAGGRAVAPRAAAEPRGDAGC
jgi:hypothetical protein